MTRGGCQARIESGVQRYCRLRCPRGLRRPGLALDRESMVLGLVGAGGLGLKLQSSLNILAWNQVTVIFIIILTMVLVSEWVSARVRHAII